MCLFIYLQIYVLLYLPDRHSKQLRYLTAIAYAFLYYLCEPDKRNIGFAFRSFENGIAILKEIPEQL